MPNRIIKESICTSEEIDRLDAQCETFFYRLMVNADDFGLLDARPAIVKSKCYPLKSIDINCIQQMLGVLSDLNLIFLYEVEGKPYLQITSWEKHQQIRAKRAKFPTPNMGREITCNQLLSNAPVIQSNPIQSESNPTAPSEKITRSPPEEKINFTEGKFTNTERRIDLWGEAYPAVNIQTEIAKAAAWLLANPKNVKQNHERFLTNWLARAQEKAPAQGGGSKSGERAFVC